MENSPALNIEKTDRPILRLRSDDGRPATHDARELIGNKDIANIVLDDKIYVLRITRAGKLILTK